ncbi:phage integrase SAM-like domain-containing protein [bacterium]|nr:phage integrase SAM-like domain-containing protein [bacterium]MBU1873703.1 phage integrase SAM-like domain-containing protein [bacterium]
MASIKKFTTSKGTGYRIDYYDSDRNRKVKHVYCDRLTAESIAKEIEHRKARILLGLDQIQDSNISFETAKIYYLRKIETQKEPSTIVREKKVYKAFIKYIGDTPIRNITVSSIEGYIKTRSEIDKVSPAGIGLELRTLRAFFNFLIKRGYLKINPVSGVKGPRQKDKKIRFLTTAEILY